MSYRQWGQWYSTAAATDASIYQKVTSTRNLLLKAARASVIFYGNPTLTALVMKIYSNNGGVPGVVLATSTNTQAKVDLITQDNALVDMYFEFNYFNMRKNDYYHFVLNATGYTYSESSHIAWRKAFPNPYYTANITADMNKLGVYPYHLELITGKL